MGNDSLQNIHISIDQNRASSFFYFIEKGVKKEIIVGQSIRAMLSDQLNISHKCPVNYQINSVVYIH